MDVCMNICVYRRIYMHMYMCMYMRVCVYRGEYWKKTLKRWRQLCWNKDYRGFFLCKLFCHSGWFLNNLKSMIFKRHSRLPPCPWVLAKVGWCSRWPGCALRGWAVAPLLPRAPAAWPHGSLHERMWESRGRPPPVCWRAAFHPKEAELPAPCSL